MLAQSFLVMLETLFASSLLTSDLLGVFDNELEVVDRQTDG